MFSFVYECALSLLGLVFLPKVLFDMWSKGKYKANFAARCGLNFPDIAKRGRSLVWIHAVSMGETKAIAALAKKLAESENPPLILISSITETGHAEAKKSMPFADHHVYLPFDFAGIIKPLVSRVRPDLVILCETDLWYNFLKSCRACRAKIVIVNGKISEKSKNRFKRFGFLARRLFGLVDLFCIQSTHYLHRFLEIGIDPKKLNVTGNVKFDQKLERLSSASLNGLRDRLGICQEDLVVVIGSTHPKEEEILLEQMKLVWKEFPSCRVVIVPRHPERFDEVAALIADKGIKIGRYSQGASQEASVILIDCMGLLLSCYQLADVAIVAGSFTPSVGGHNILEPLYCDIPTIFGPYMHSQPELVSLVLDGEAGLQVDSDNVGEATLQLLKHKDECLALIDRGIDLVEKNKGATDRSLAAILSLSQKNAIKGL